MTDILKELNLNRKITFETQCNKGDLFALISFQDIIPESYSLFFCGTSIPSGHIAVV